MALQFVVHISTITWPVFMSAKTKPANMVSSLAWHRFLEAGASPQGIVGHLQDSGSGQRKSPPPNSAKLQNMVVPAHTSKIQLSCVRLATKHRTQYISCVACA